VRGAGVSLAGPMAALGPLAASPARPAEVPLIRQIAAGVSLDAQEAVEGAFALPRELVGHGELFMLRVRGTR
jgi:repressor LexA